MVALHPIMGEMFIADGLFFSRPTIAWELNSPKIIPLNSNHDIIICV